MLLFYILIAFLILILLSPLIFAFTLFYLGTTGFTHIGFSSMGAVFILFLMLIASLVNIPLAKRKLVRVEESCFFGFARRYVWKAQGVSLNLGGALIPLFISVYLLLDVPLYPVLVSVCSVAFVAFLSSRFVPGKGVVASAVFPVLVAVILALTLSPDHAAETAFISGVLGVIFGADIIRLPFILRKEGGVMSIGGAGVFDGIFIVGIASAVLAGI